MSISDPRLQNLPGLDLIPWETVESQWQQKIRLAILAESLPSFLLLPHTQQSLAEAVKLAWENQWVLLPCGSGSKLSWGGLVNNPQLVLSSQGLNRIIEHAVGDLTLTVEAGVKLADLQQLLQASGQFLPLDPAYPESATIGGIVATADSGSWRQRYGGVRDMVLGLSFVRGDGAIAKAGGRVVKNVAGYDLMKLLAGSYGSLGIISQVTFRVYPLPAASATIVLTGEEREIAIAAQTLLKSGLTPTAAELLSSSLVESLDLGQRMGLMVRFQSIPASVREQLGQVEVMGRQLGLPASSYQQAGETNLWQRLKNLMGKPPSESAVTCKIGVMPVQAVKTLAALPGLIGDRGLGKINLSSGLGRLYLEEVRSVSQLAKLRFLCQDCRGFLTILEASLSLKQQFEPWGYRGNALPMMRKLKEKFDPKNILSPGRFVGGI